MVLALEIPLQSAFKSKTGSDSSADVPAPGNSREQLEKVAQAKCCEGDAMLKEARASMGCPLGSLERCWDTASLKVVSDAIWKYKAAISKYSEGLQLAPQSHNLLSHRAACFATMEDWSRCGEDALSLTQLRPDILDGWTLLIQAMLERRDVNAARQQIGFALNYHPGCQEILQLQDQLEAAQGTQLGRVKNSSLQAESRSLPSTPVRQQTQAESCSHPSTPVRLQSKRAMSRPKTSPPGSTSPKLAVAGLGSPLPVLLPGAARRRGTGSVVLCRGVVESSSGKESSSAKQCHAWHAQHNDRRGVSPHAKLPSIAETSGRAPLG